MHVKFFVVGACWIFCLSTNLSTTVSGSPLNWPWNRPAADKTAAEIKTDHVEEGNPTAITSFVEAVDNKFTTDVTDSLADKQQEGHDDQFPKLSRRQKASILARVAAIFGVCIYGGIKLKYVIMS